VGKFLPGSVGVGETMKPIGGARVAVTPGCSNLKKRRLLANTPRPRRPGWADWAESEGINLFRIKFDFWIIARLWKIVEGDLDGILT
jgi:hypothetical protein